MLFGCCVGLSMGGGDGVERSLTMVSDDLIHETYPEEQAEVEARIREIMSAA
jgi:hypothetical protein